MAWEDIVPSELRTPEQLFEVIAQIRKQAFPPELKKVILWDILKEMVALGRITPDMARRWSRTAPFVQMRRGRKTYSGGTNQGWYVEGDRIRPGDLQLWWLLLGDITEEEYCRYRPDAPPCRVWR